MIHGFDFSDKKECKESVFETYQAIIDSLLFYTERAKESPEECTHQIRKKLKLFRAFVKLLKSGSNESDYQNANIFLRDSGREFSGLRDAHVRKFLIHEMIHSNSVEHYQSTLSALSNRILEEIRAIEKTMFGDENRFKWLSNKLKNESIVNLYVAKANVDFRILSDSYIHTFEKSRIAFENSFEHNNADLLHEWRKRMKDVQYQTELMAGETHALSLPFYSRVVHLCNHLGIINDLHMLKDWIAGAGKDDFENEHFPAIINKTNQQASVFLKEAEQLGNMLFELSSGELTESVTAVIYHE